MPQQTQKSTSAAQEQPSTEVGLSAADGTASTEAPQVVVGSRSISVTKAPEKFEEQNNPVVPQSQPSAAAPTPLPVAPAPALPPKLESGVVLPEANELGVTTGSLFETETPHVYVEPKSVRYKHAFFLSLKLTIGAAILLAMFSLAVIRQVDDISDLTPTQQPRIEDTGSIGLGSDKTLKVTVVSSFEKNASFLGVLSAQDINVTGTINGYTVDQLAAGGAAQNGRDGARGLTGAAGANGINGADGQDGQDGQDGAPGTASCPNGDCLSLQAGSPGIQETGSINISGSALFGGNSIVTGSLTVDTDTLFVDSTNNRVGIGRTDPGFKLVVTDSVDPRFTIENTGDTTVARDSSVNFMFQNTVNARIIGRRASGGVNGADILFYTQPVAGGALIERGGFQQDGDFYVDSNTLFVDATTNNVGIQTTAPTSRLQIGVGTSQSVTLDLVEDTPTLGFTDLGQVAPAGRFQIYAINDSLRAWRSGVGDLLTISNSGILAHSALGAANTATYLCRNASNQIASCNTTGAGVAFLQNGNSFGATAILGTNDSNTLAFEVNNLTQATLAVGGAATFTNTTDSTAGFQVLNAASEDIFLVDTTNRKVAVGDYTAGSTTGQLQIIPTATGRVGLVIQESVGQTGNLFELRDSGGTNTRLVLDNLGGAIFNDQGLATADFRIEGDANANLFFVDASADAIGIGDSTPDAQLDIDSTATTGNIFRIDSSTITGGDFINIQNTSSVSAGSDMFFGLHQSSYSTNVTNSGSLLDLSRDLTTTANTLTLSGPLAQLVSNCTVSGGACTDTSNILSLNQQYASASGVVLNVTNNGTGLSLRVNDDGTTADSSPFIIDASGNVAIGATTSTLPLHVVRAQDTNTVLGVTNTNAGTSATASVSVRNGGAITDGLTLGATGTGYTSSGVFLQDGGAIAAESNLSGGLAIATLASADIRFATNGAANERLRILSDGSLGLGTTTTGLAKQVNAVSSSATTLFSNAAGGLGIVNTDQTNNNWAYIYFGDDSTNNAATAIGTRIIDHTNNYGDMRFATKDVGGLTDRVTILSGGNVGIGDTTPAYTLTVGSGDLFGVNSSGNVIVTALEATDGTTAICRNASNFLAACTGAGANTLQGAYDGGNTITTTDARNIQVTLANTTTDQTFEITQAGTAIAFRVNDDGTFTDSTPFVINDQGQVGIGTTTPSFGVDVAAKSFGLSGTHTTTNSVRLSVGGTLNSSVTATQFGIQNAPSFDPSGASLATLYGNSNNPTISGSALAITTVSATHGRIDTGAGFTGSITNGYTAWLQGPTLNGANKIAILVGLQVEGYGNASTDNSGNTSGTLNNYGIRIGSTTAEAGTGGTINNFGAYINVPNGSGTNGTTNNYGLRIVGNSTAGDTNYSFYNESTATSYFAGNVGIATTSPNALLEIQTAGSGNELLRLSSTSAGNYASFTNTGINMNRATGSGTSYVLSTTNSGSWGAGADAGSIQFAPDNTTRMIVRRDGNVGIGDTTPSVRLDVTGAGGAIDTVAFRSTPSATLANQITLDNLTGAGNHKNQISFQAQGSEQWSLGNDIDGDGSQNFFLWDQDAGVSRIQVNSNGVGIGPDTINPGYALYVADSDGDFALRDTDNANIWVWDASGSSDTFSLFEEGNSAIVTVHPDRIGIGGSATADYKLEVSHATTATTGARGIYSTTTATTASTSGSAYYAVNGILTLVPATATSLTFSGNAGIRGQVQNSGAGTVDYMVGGLFQVGQTSTGNVGTEAGLRVLSPYSTSSGTVTTTYGLIIDAQDTAFNTNAYGLYQGGSADLNYFAGNVGIGATVPGYKLEIEGNGDTSFIVLDDNNGSFQDNVGIKNTGDIFVIRDESSNADLLTIGLGGSVPEGSVGIGDTTPSSETNSNFKLDVNGDLRVNGDINTHTDMALNFNAYWNGTNMTRIATETAFGIHHNSGDNTLNFLYATSDTAGSTFNYTKAVSLDSNGQLGIGTTAPNHRLTVTAPGSDDGIAVRMHSDTSNVSPNLNFERSRGTEGSPTSVDDDDELGHIIFRGYNSTTATYQNAAWILGSAEDADATHTSGYLSFATGTLSANPSERVRITNSALQPGAAGTIDLGSNTREWDALYIGDNDGIRLGLDQEVLLAYDEATDDRTELTGSGASLFIEDRLGLGKQAFTTAAGGAGTETLTPATSYVAVTVTDDGDILQISEASAKDGDILIIVNVDSTAADTVVIDDITDQVDVGAADLSLDKGDTVTLVYSSDLSAWVRVSSSDNSP